MACNIIYYSCISKRVDCFTTSTYSTTNTMMLSWLANWLDGCGTSMPHDSGYIYRQWIQILYREVKCCQRAGSTRSEWLNAMRDRKSANEQATWWLLRLVDILVLQCVRTYDLLPHMNLTQAYAYLWHHSFKLQYHSHSKHKRDNINL